MKKVKARWLGVLSLLCAIMICPILVKSYTSADNTTVPTIESKEIAKARAATSTATPAHSIPSYIPTANETRKTAAKALGKELADLFVNKEDYRNTEASHKHFAVASYAYPMTVITTPVPTSGYRKYTYTCYVKNFAEKEKITSGGDISSFAKMVFEEAQNCLQLDYQYDSVIKRDQEPGGSFVNSEVKLKFVVSYRTTRAQDLEMEDRADKLAKRLVGTDYEKIKQLYDYFVENYKFCEDHYDGEYVYHISTANNCLCYTPYGALVNHEAVCQGFAQAFQVVLKKAGVECWYVFGDFIYDSGKVEGHGWNMVKLGDKYYYLDVTNDLNSKRKPIDYQCFLKGYSPVTKENMPDGRIRVFKNHYQHYDKDTKKLSPLVRINVQADFPYKSKSPWYSDYKYEFATVKASKTTATVSWNMNTFADFVIIDYSTNSGKTWTNYGTYYAKGAKATGNMTLKGLKANTNYMIRVTAYKKINGERTTTTYNLKFKTAT